MKSPSSKTAVTVYAKTLLWSVVLLSLLPGLWLAQRRVQSEDSSRNVTLLMDEIALREQADLLGISSLELAERYRAAGLNGIALYEETFESLAHRGDIVKQDSEELRAQALLRGELLLLETIPPASTLISPVAPGIIEEILLKNAPDARFVTLNGQTWYVYPGQGRTRPAGPRRQSIAAWQQADWDIAYRPRNFPGLRAVGADFPSEANYIIHAGLEIAGNPNGLEALIAASQGFITGIIEGTDQDGMPDIVGQVPAMRVFGINQDWLNTLDPDEVADKYLLAANERGARLLYLRPYTREKMGDMFANTEQLVRRTRTLLERDGFRIAQVTPTVFETVGSLRLLSAVGILAGLILLATMYPGAWGIFVSTAVLALCILAGRGLNWDALALCAALVFPVLGYGLLPEKLHSFGLATLISLIGAVLLAAVGSDQGTMLAARPFVGVAATLVVPPALFLFHYALRFKTPAQWIVDFWERPVRLGDVALALIGVAGLGLILIRRGNFPIIGASNLELQIRDWLSQAFARPRFKELVGHPLAVLALSNPRWAAWMKGLLLTGGVIAQSTIINSFSHYHTPLLISLERTAVAFVLGGLLGLLAVPITRLLSGGMTRWLQAARPLQRSSS